MAALLAVLGLVAASAAPPFTKHADNIPAARNSFYTSLLKATVADCEARW